MSFYIRAPKGRTQWYLWETIYKDGKRTRKAVPEGAYSGFGINPKMTVDEAKSRVSRLNKEKSLEKQSLSKAARNERKIEFLKSVYLPDHLNEKFLNHLKENLFTSEKNFEKLLIHWQTAQKIIHSLKVLPVEYWSSRKQIYRWIVDNKTSLSYGKKLIRMINEWGAFVCDEQGQDYKPVPNPRGYEANMIADAHHDVRGRRGISAPLTPELLEKMKDAIKELPGQYEWLYVSLWFGLRPTEVDHLTDAKHFKISYDAKLRIDVLEVYQPKLKAVAKEQRWKYIPVFLDEQKIALDYIKAGILKRPLAKTIQKYSNVPDLTLYGGRKAFTDLMLSLNQKLEDIAMWLGHKDIHTTWRHYKQKNTVTFTKAS